MNLTAPHCTLCHPPHRPLLRHPAPPALRPAATARSHRFPSSTTGPGSSSTTTTTAGGSKPHRHGAAWHSASCPAVPSPCLHARGCTHAAWRTGHHQHSPSSTVPGHQHSHSSSTVPCRSRQSGQHAYARPGGVPFWRCWQRSAASTGPARPPAWFPCSTAWRHAWRWAGQPHQQCPCRCQCRPTAGHAGPHLPATHAEAAERLRTTRSPSPGRTRCTCHCNSRPSQCKYTRNRRRLCSKGGPGCSRDSTNQLAGHSCCCWRGPKRSTGASERATWRVSLCNAAASKHPGSISTARQHGRTESGNSRCSIKQCCWCCCRQCRSWSWSAAQHTAACCKSCRHAPPHAARL